MKDMTTYNILTDMLLLEDELKEYDLYRNWELFDGDDGYVTFIQEKIEEFEKQVDKYYLANGNPNNWGIGDAMGDFVAKNVDKWKRELRGDHRYKIKVVLELDIEANKDVSLESLIYDVKYDDDTIYVGDNDRWELKNKRIINAIGKEVDE